MNHDPSCGKSGRSAPLIGILAGMGPRSTAPFIDAVVDQCQRQYGARLDEEFPRMMILSLPTPFYVDRPIDHRLMKATILGGLDQLVAAGVDFVAMPCNSAHLYYDDLAAAVDVPLLNIITETLSCLPRSGRTALLATRGTVDSGLYQARFREISGPFLCHDAWQTNVDRILLSIKAGDAEGILKSQWQELVGDMENEGIAQAIIACTDLSVLLPLVPTDIDFADSTDALAAATVRRYLSMV
jgi:aspartate racemase